MTRLCCLLSVIVSALPVLVSRVGADLQGWSITASGLSTIGLLRKLAKASAGYGLVSICQSSKLNKLRLQALWARLETSCRSLPRGPALKVYTPLLHSTVYGPQLGLIQR
jgi:hypothetical protein